MNDIFRYEYVARLESLMKNVEYIYNDEVEPIDTFHGIYHVLAKYGNYDGQIIFILYFDLFILMNMDL